MKFTKYILIAFIFFVSCYAMGQSKADLERKKKENYNNIKITNDLLKATKKEKQVSYNQLVLLNKKINSRQKIIETINDEINYVNEQIAIHQDITYNLEQDLQKLKDDYAKMVYHSFLNNDKYTKLMFILASDNFNMGYRRLRYYQQYSKYRKNQAALIKETQEKINEELVVLDIIRAEKNELMLNETLEKDLLFTEKQTKNKSLKKLKLKEGELKIRLKEQYKIAQNLQKEIERIIEEEARLAALRNKSNSPEFFKLTPDERIISENISKNKFGLPWPIQRGVVVAHFGPNKHEDYKGIIVENDGIDIATFEGATVRSVFEGEVTSVFALPGLHKNVIIRHGNFLTVYSNLKDVIVKQGDKISTKQTIGVVYTDKKNDNKTILKFQIWKENEKMDPENWLAKGKNG